MQEIYKPIKGYEGLYEVSNLGNVKSFKHKQPIILKPKMIKGYPTVSLCINGQCKQFGIHRLVAESFINKIPDKNEINHIDGNKANNSVDNLEWCTHTENVRHAFRTGLIQRKPLTDEQKRYVSERTKEAMKRPEVMEKVKAPRPHMLGSKRSEDTKRKMREAWVRRKARKEVV